MEFNFLSYFQKQLHANRWFLAVLGSMLLVRGVAADYNYVPTGSMRPTIQEGDVIAVNRLAYDLKIPLTKVALATMGEPKRGDVVVFSSPDAKETKLVKRLIGLPGDVVAMHKKILTINGEPLQYKPVSIAIDTINQNSVLAQHLIEDMGPSPHTVQWLDGHDAESSFGPIEVPQGMYLMLGDNRDNSADSRYFGFVPRANLIGKVGRVLFSFALDAHKLPRTDRIGEPL